MLTNIQTEAFIDDNRHAIDHLFQSLSEYHRARSAAQTTAEEIDQAKQHLSDLFMYRDQWSSNANYHYAQYIVRLKDLSELRDNPEDERLADALARIDATTDSMSLLAGAILQIAKQILSLRYGNKPSLPHAKKIGSQNIVEVIWEGRNYAAHWEENPPKKEPVKTMLANLAADLGTRIEYGKNNCLSILGALDWKSADDVISDLKALVN